jgi:Protein of unknown function (DUF2924)
MFNSSVTDQLSSLPDLDKLALFKLWRQLFKADPPHAIRKELLVQFLAYRLQEEEFGKAIEVTHRRLRELSSALEDSASCSQTIKPGTRLVRQWKDQVHTVNVEEGNYEYRGARYESLSEIARLITGTRWSGPLFFGLKNRRTNNSLESA